MPIAQRRPDPYAATLTDRPVPRPPPQPDGSESQIVTQGYGPGPSRAMTEGY